MSRDDPPQEVTWVEDHGDESDEPEFDERLDPEAGETEFRVDPGRELEQDDMHEVDHDLGIYE